MSPWTIVPLDKSLLGQKSLGQKSPWTKVSLDKSPLGQKSPWTIAPWTIVLTPSGTGTHDITTPIILSNNPEVFPAIGSLQKGSNIHSTPSCTNPLNVEEFPMHRRRKRACRYGYFSTPKIMEWLLRCPTPSQPPSKSNLDTSPSAVHPFNPKTQEETQQEEEIPSKPFPSYGSQAISRRFLHPSSFYCC